MALTLELPWPVCTTTRYARRGYVGALAWPVGVAGAFPVNATGAALDPIGTLGVPIGTLKTLLGSCGR